MSYLAHFVLNTYLILVFSFDLFFELNKKEKKISL